MNYDFTDVTLLVTHYNRPNSLENLLKSFHDFGCSFAKIVVSDDGSNEESLNAIRELGEVFKFHPVYSEYNCGLGHNINKGQEIVYTSFTLYVQEDFLPTKQFPEILNTSLNLMERDRELDLIRFYAEDPHPYLYPYSNDNQFSEMHFRLFARKYKKIYCYSDTPHLRRQSFFEKFGRYTERINGDQMEYKMCVSFIKNKGKSILYNDSLALFSHENTDEEPSMMRRGNWRHSNNIFISIIRNIYRQLKYNYDILVRSGI